MIQDRFLEAPFGSLSEWVLLSDEKEGALLQTSDIPSHSETKYISGKSNLPGLAGLYERT